MNAHDKDHDRLAAARNAWLAAGKPGNKAKGGKRITRHILGLRINAHAAGHHHKHLGIGWTFADALADHDAGRWD